MFQNVEDFKVGDRVWIKPKRVTGPNTGHIKYPTRAVVRRVGSVAAHPISGILMRKYLVSLPDFGGDEIVAWPTAMTRHKNKKPKLPISYVL